MKVTTLVTTAKVTTISCEISNPGCIGVPNYLNTARHTNLEEAMKSDLRTWGFLVISLAMSTALTGCHEEPRRNPAPLDLPSQSNPTAPTIPVPPIPIPAPEPVAKAAPLAPVPPVAPVLPRPPLPQEEPAAKPVVAPGRVAEKALPPQTVEAPKPQPEPAKVSERRPELPKMVERQPEEAKPLIPPREEKKVIPPSDVPIDPFVSLTLNEVTGQQSEYKIDREIFCLVRGSEQGNGKILQILADMKEGKVSASLSISKFEPGVAHRDYQFAAEKNSESSVLLKIDPEPGTIMNGDPYVGHQRVSDCRVSIDQKGIEITGKFTCTNLFGPAFKPFHAKGSFACKMLANEAAAAAPREQNGSASSYREEIKGMAYSSEARSPREIDRDNLTYQLANILTDRKKFDEGAALDLVKAGADVSAGYVWGEREKGSKYERMYGNAYAQLMGAAFELDRLPLVDLKKRLDFVSKYGDEKLLHKLSSRVFLFAMNSAIDLDRMNFKMYQGESLKERDEAEKQRSAIDANIATAVEFLLDHGLEARQVLSYRSLGMMSMSEVTYRGTPLAYLKEAKVKLPDALEKRLADEGKPLDPPRFSKP